MEVTGNSSAATEFREQVYRLLHCTPTSFDQEKSWFDFASFVENQKRRLQWQCDTVWEMVMKRYLLF